MIKYGLLAVCDHCGTTEQGENTQYRVSHISQYLLHSQRRLIVNEAVTFSTEELVQKAFAMAIMKVSLIIPSLDQITCTKRSDNTYYCYFVTDNGDSFSGLFFKGQDDFAGTVYITETRKYGAERSVACFSDHPFDNILKEYEE
jgi:hypothetical protein